MADKVVRFKVDAEVWKEFRVLAVENDRSASSYLGTLVEKEVWRARAKRGRGKAVRGGDGS